MEMNRRGFLGALTAILAASAVPVSAATIMVNKYEHTLALMDDIIEYTKALRLRLETEVLVRNDSDLNNKLNKLFGFVCDEFVVPKHGSLEYKVVQVEVRNILNKGFEDEELRSNPPIFLEAAFVIAIMRNLLTTHKIRPHFDSLSNWGRFGDLYEQLVVSA